MTSLHSSPAVEMLVLYYEDGKRVPQDVIDESKRREAAMDGCNVVERMVATRYQGAESVKEAGWFVDQK